jgi:hypothetical protein
MSRLFMHSHVGVGEIDLLDIPDCQTRDGHEYDGDAWILAELFQG